MIKLLFTLFIFHAFSIPALSSEKLAALEVAQKSYDRYIGEDIQLKGTMELISPKGHVRQREYISLRKDSNNQRKQLIRFTAPADIKGTSFLTLENENSTKTEQHLYLPALKRTRRIVASQKGRSFVNSDFTYEDMKRSPVEEWEYQLKNNSNFLNRECYVLISTPKPKTDTQYSKKESIIDKEHFITLKTVFWDKKGREAKVYTVQKFELIDKIATEIESTMKDLQSGHKTKLKNQKIAYNKGLEDAYFTTRALEK